MRRAGVVLIVLAVALVIVGFVMRLSNDDDDEPSPSPTSTTQALPTRSSPPAAACDALGTIKLQLSATVGEVQAAMEAEDGAALATAVEQAIGRRSAFLTAIGNLEASVDAEYVPDVQTVADSTTALFDRIAAIDLAASKPALREEVLTTVEALRNDEGFQESFSRLNSYLISCPA